MIVNILGTEYEIEVRKYEEDKTFSRMECCGYCKCSSKKIVLCDMKTYKGWEFEDREAVESQMMKTKRHEIVHAFLEESGLSSNSNDEAGPWARNEEIVDWISLQGPKIFEAWKKAGAV